MRRTAALAWMRTRAFAGSRRSLGPLLAGLALLGVAYAGGPAEPEQAYGFASALLLGIYAWQGRSVLDTEPDEQRMLARTAVGSVGRETAAGLLAVWTATLPLVVLAVLAPAALGAVDWSGAAGLGSALGFGLWAHTVAALCGTGFGALASRAVISSANRSTMIVVGVSVLVLVLGSRTESPVRWMVPPVLRFAEARGWSAIALVNLLAVAWILILFGGYATLRRARR